MRSFALLLVVVAAAPSLHAQGTTAVSGVVRDETGSAIREALVVIDPDSLRLRTRTDTAGRFRIASVPSGRYEVRVVRIGYRAHSRLIDVTGRELEISVELRSVPIPLDTVAVRASRPGVYGLVVTRGISLLPHEPRPLHVARVEALNEPHSAITGTDGRFGMPQLAEGAHSVIVSLDGYVTKIVPVTVPPDQGVEITVTLDSLYAEYQRWDEDQLRGISARVRRAINPAAFVPMQEIDPEAANLRDALRYSYSLLSRGLIIRQGCIYLDGRPRPDLALQDISTEGIQGIEVYPPFTLQDGWNLAPINPLTPCGGVTGGPFPAAVGRRTSANRTLVRERGNAAQIIMIWTKARQ